MGIRCTVMGHDYGESQRTEKREERGDEMVVTVREYRECRRCGHQKTISENTEVRSEETTPPDDAEDTDGMNPDSTADHGVTATTETDEMGFDHDTIDTSSEDDETDEGPTAAEDDGIILKDETDDGRSPGESDDAQSPGESDEGRSPGEWPDVAKENPERAHGHGDDSGTGGDWPTPDVEDQGYDAKPTSADSDDDVEFVSDLADESAASTTEESAPEETAAGGDSPSQSDSTSGIARADADPAAQQPPSGDTAVLSCPQCGHTRPSRASSLRPGDICPKCGDGYLAEREE